MHRAITLWRARLRLVVFALSRYRPIMGAQDPPADPPKGDPPKDPPPADPPKDPPKPPWGSDEDFDPQKAWKLIQDIRGDLTQVKADRDDLKTKVQEHERANESAADKAAREKDEAEKRATKAEAQALRLDVALDKAPEGMTIAQVRKLAKRLSGTTKEELEADADELFEDFKGNDDSNPPPSRPRERLRSGNGGSSEPEENDPKKLAEQVSPGW